MDISQLWNEYKVSPIPELKKKIMINYIRLVHYVIHNSRFINMDILEDRDYFQFGIEGLSQAIDRFDPDYGTKFETYAIQRIRGKIIDELRKLQKKKTSPYGIIYNNVSLNNTIDGDENYTLSDIIPSSYNNPNEEVEKNEAIEFLTGTIKNLPERDRMIISLYYYEHLNYKEISEILNITVSRVSQVHSKIIKNLKSRLAYLNV